MSLMTLRACIADPWLTRIVPTGLLLLAALLFGTGAARFRDQRPRWGWRLAAWAGASALFAWFVAVDPQPRPRQVANSLVLSVLFLLAAVELFRERRPGLRFSAHFCGLAGAILAAWFAYRGVRALAWGYVELFVPERFQLANMAASAVLGTYIAVGTVLMVSQRQVMAIRLAKDEAVLLERKLSATRSRRQRHGLLRDLHDGLGGITANLALVASQSAGAPLDAAMAERLEQLRQLVAEGSLELRLLMDSLERGETCWAEALAQMRSHATHVLGGRQVEVRWVVSGHVPDEPVPDALALFSLMRIVKEAVANLARHSDARDAHIGFRFRPGAVGIVVRDNGRGMASEPGVGRGRGMAHMRQRAKELGGRLRIRMGRGTSLCIALPLPLLVRFPATEGGRPETGGTRR